MSLKVRSLVKAPLAHRALVGWLFHVQDLVDGQGPGLAETFATFGADKWLLFGVNVSVIPKMILSPKGFATDIAWIWSLISVCPFMNKEVVWFCELPVTEFADKLFPWFVSPVDLGLYYLLRHRHYASLVTRKAGAEHVIDALLTCRGSWFWWSEWDKVVLDRGWPVRWADQARGLGAVHEGGAGGVAREGEVGEHRMEGGGALHVMCVVSASWCGGSHRCYSKISSFHSDVCISNNVNNFIRFRLHLEECTDRILEDIIILYRVSQKISPCLIYECNNNNKVTDDRFKTHLYLFPVPFLGGVLASSKHVKPSPNLSPCPNKPPQCN